MKTKSPLKKINYFIKNFFKDKNGKIIIGQWPNWPLWLALGLFFIGKIPVSELQVFSTWAMIPTMLYWSYLEIFHGDNSFRRVLGTLVALNFIYNLLQLLHLI